MKLSLYPFIFLLRIYVFEKYTGMQNLTCFELAVLFIKLKQDCSRTSTKQRPFDIKPTPFWSL